MKKILAFVLAIAMIASIAVLSGCSGDKKDSGSDSGKAVLKMATNAEFPPYEYKEDGKTVIGIDAEIAQAIAIRSAWS